MWGSIAILFFFFFEGYGDPRDLHRVGRRQRQMCIRDSSSPASIATLTETDVTESFPGSLPGIDKQTAMEMVDGDLEVYREALKLFIRSIRNLEETFRDALSRGCFSEAGRTLHLTKGAAMAVGANTFARSCDDLEKSMKERMPETLEPILGQWLRQLNELLKSKEIENLIREGPR